MSQEIPGTAAAMSATPGGGLPPRFARNATMNYVHDAVTGLSALVVTPVLLAGLGDAGYGVWALASGALVYLDLFGLGFGAATVKLVAEDLARRPGDVVRTINANFFMLLLFGALALLAGMALAAASPALFDVPAALRSEAVWTFGIMAVSVALAVPLDTAGFALAGFQRWDLLSGANTLSAVLVGVASVVVVLLDGGLVPLAASNALVLISVHAMRWGMLRRLLPDLRISRGLVERRHLSRTARLSGWLLAQDLAKTATHQLDVILVGILLGVGPAAVYAVAAKLALLGRRGIRPLSRLFFPYASGLATEDDPTRLRTLVVDGNRTTMVIALPVTLVLAFLAGPAIGAWVGPDYDDAVTVVVLLGCAHGVFALSETLWYIVSGAGRVRLAALVRVTEATLNVVLSVVLGLSIGVAGVALATLTSAVLVSLPLSIVAAARLAAISTTALLRQVVQPHVVPTLVVGLVLFLVHDRLPPSPVPVVLTAACALVGYVLVYLAFGATSGERRQLVRLVRPSRRQT